MRRFIAIVLLIISLAASASEPIADFTQSEIQSAHIPGAVVLIGNRTSILYRNAFGQRAAEPMTTDTRFDLASLTKVIATTTAIMQLIEQKKLRLDAPVARYWPAFAKNGKGLITLRQLLTHYSGMRADLNLDTKWSGYAAAMKLIVAQQPVAMPGSSYLYSDINFEILGELVGRVSGKPLDSYCDAHIFRTLRMSHTGFKPDTKDDIAPTRSMNSSPGVVHDPSAYRMGGVAGHAGLFSTADDLAVFARMMLNGGTWQGRRILSRHAVQIMTIPQSPVGMSKLRGLGWALGAPFSPEREQLSGVGSYGHYGYTGTMLWIDPVSQTFLIVLSNRVYLDGKGDADPLRRGIVAIVSDTLKPQTDLSILAARPELAGYFKFTTAHPESRSVARVLTGLDVLEAEAFAPLTGLRIGVITNQTGKDAAGHYIVDLLYKAPGVRLAAIFSPEHGISGNVDEKVVSGIDIRSGLPIYSLYGESRRPRDEMLGGLDALVFDIQDAGARFYTFSTTMAYAMEAAAQHNLDFYVLDRPNPISAAVVQGPIPDADMKSFTSYFPLPVRHGMTVGELAELFNEQIHAKLHVIRMQGYARPDWYDDTGLKWISPSPNLRTLTETTLYPGVGLIEGANISVGRGTSTPFELVGAPWIDGKGLADELNRRSIAGIFFLPADFTPESNSYAHQQCHGVRLILIDRHALDSPLLGLEIASALHQRYPGKFQLMDTLGMIGARKVLQAISEGQNPKNIPVQDDVDMFNTLRSRHLLY